MHSHSFSVRTQHPSIKLCPSLWYHSCSIVPGLSLDMNNCERQSSGITLGDRVPFADSWTHQHKNLKTDLERNSKVML